MPEKFIANKFSTVMPAGWGDRSTVSLVNLQPSPSGFAANVVVLREEVAARTSIEDYARRQIEQMSSQISDLQLLDQRPTKINGKPAFEILQRFAANNLQLQQAQTFILHDATVFAVICTAPLTEFDRMIPAFREIMQNLTFD